MGGKEIITDIVEIEAHRTLKGLSDPCLRPGGRCEMQWG